MPLDEAGGCEVIGCRRHWRRVTRRPAGHGCGGIPVGSGKWPWTNTALVSQVVRLVRSPSPIPLLLLPLHFPTLTGLLGRFS
jgi:hypothetical protein